VSPAFFFVYGAYRAQPPFFFLPIMKPFRSLGFFFSAWLFPAHALFAVPLCLFDFFFPPLSSISVSGMSLLVIDRVPLYSFPTLPSDVRRLGRGGEFFMFPVWRVLIPLFGHVSRSPPTHPSFFHRAWASGARRF